MPFTEDMKDIVENMISSYETRVQSIEAAFDTTYQFMRGYHELFLYMGQERGRVEAELRESLARNSSLRRKDFDSMMSGIISMQDERERELRNLLNSYLNEQKGVAQTLRDNLREFRNSLVRGEVQRIKKFQILIKEILARQDERKEEVTSKLKEFQRERKNLALRLKGLLSKGRELRINDLKLMLREFKSRHRERISQRNLSCPNEDKGYAG